MTGSEFKPLSDMTEDELQHERSQHWVIVKSDTSWWIYRNHSPFMCAGTEANAIAVLTRYGISAYGVNRSQKATTEREWADFRRDKMRVLSGHGPSLARRVWRFFGGDAA